MPRVWCSFFLKRIKGLTDAAGPSKSAPDGPLPGGVGRTFYAVSKEFGRRPATFAPDDGQDHPGMRPTAAARLHVAQPLQPGNGDRAGEQGDLGDRTTTGRLLQAHPGPRPPRAITEDGGGR